MKRSTDRILTTHMGSLPRPDMLADLLVAQAEGKEVDAARIPALTDAAMDHIVRRQLEAGIDVGNDGEMPRSTFFGYIIGRMSGFGGQSNRRPILDMQHFPKWWQNFQARGTRRLNVYGFPAAIGPVRYESLDGGPNSARAELDAFARALARQTQRFAETFVTAVSPGFAACSMENQHYDSHEAYVFALARELKQEYEFIVAEGHVLQIDSPDLGIERAGYFQDEPLPKFIAAMEMHVAALNEALAGIPTERVRFHACWGNRDSPHVNDVPATDVLPVCYQVKAGALCLPFANPRHSHEVDAFRTQKLPDRMTLVCGVVETTHNYVEHPQVVAERLERAVRAVGDRERVMAGTDCGFGTIVGDTQVSEDVVWAKLEAMRDGAAIASKRLWRRGGTTGGEFQLARQ
jgi:5-methyltetrahydropteroyltriglutamate--homocysteine methyltransferase